jgi:hypothetical protein
VLHQLRGPFQEVNSEPTQVDIFATESAFLSKITACQGGDLPPWPFSSHQIVVEAAKHLIHHSDYYTVFCSTWHENTIPQETGSLSSGAVQSAMQCMV